MMTDITAKSTKQQILDAYLEAKEKLDAMEATKDDPRIEAQKNEAIRTEKSAKDIINMSILSTDIVNQYNDLCADIEAKKAQLKELYGIEAQANSLVAMINAQKEIQHDIQISHEIMLQKHMEENKANEQEWESKILEKKMSYEAAQKELKEEYELVKRDLALTRKREAEEYNYNLNRQRQLENDKWADEKAAREKELDERELTLEGLEKEVAEKMLSVSELQEKVNSIPELIEAATSEGKKMGKAEAEKSHVFEVRAINQKNEYEVQSLKDKIERLEVLCEEKSNTIDDLRAKLDKSYSEIRELATETVKSTGGVKILNHENSGK